MPIQRIPRYVMLLQDMVKHTNKNHPDYDNLKQSLTKVQEIAIYCNEKKREADQMAETFKIESKISGLSNIVNPSRRFLRGGVTYIKPKNGKKIIECYLHLFNDLLIISKKAKKLKLLNIIELDLETYILNSHPYIIEDNSQNNNININIIQNKGNNSNNNSDNSDNNGSNGNTATTATNSNNSNNKNDDDKDDNNDQEEPTQLFGFTIRNWTFFKKDNDFTFGTTFYFDSKIEKLEWITAFDRLKNNRMEDFKTRTTKEINNPELLAKNTEIDFLKEKQWSMEKIHQKSKKGGYLMKHSHTKIQNIKHSFLVLLRDNLLIFKYNMEEEETYISDLSKTIFLGTCSVAFNPNYQNGLQILTPDRIYYFSSKKLENTLKWICVLRKQTYQLLNAKLKEEKKLRGIEDINTDEKTSSKEFDKLTINVHNLKNRVSDSPKTRSKRMSLRILSSPISPLREKKKNLFENIKFGDQVFKKGYIHKHSSNIFKEWKQRYAVLKANHLLFFNNEKEQDYLTEVIDLAFCKFEIRVNNKFILEKKFAFDLVTSDRIYILKCKTRNGLFEWMEAIQNRIKSIEDLTHRNVQQELINISNSGENVKNGEKGENKVENKVEEREERMKERKGRKERKKGKEDRRKKRRGRNEEREERRKDERGGKRREERQDRRKERRERREKKGNKKLLEKKVKEEQD
ncbi:faciogenital dysplasia protein [Anaeramoeba flamelloides]|uniref:Faciogenital dysplasia protein n=1 Tax=Anaeramoeba flamelloides TaxID=1746091 RepID=A0ABQ8YLD6_9EUKA|nr:faciogenital dysplasia protein [Anaeramoeba flamelloides]